MTLDHAMDPKNLRAAMHSSKLVEVLDIRFGPALMVADILEPGRHFG